MSTRIITESSEIDIKKWYDFVLNHPNGNVFQTPYMYKVYEDSPYHQPYIFVAFDEDEIVGILLAFIQKQFNGPLSFLSARSIIWGGPLVKKDDPEIFIELLSKYDKAISGKSVYTQIRNMFSTNQNKKLFSEHKYLYEEHLNIIIDLSMDEDVLWNKINSKGRNKIRRAQQGNCIFKVKLDKEALSIGYDMLKERYKKARIPLNDKKFFLNLLNKSDRHSQLIIFTSYLNDTLIASRIALLYNNCIYDFYAASNPNFHNLHPNDFLIWEIIKWGKNNGFKTFDFGGAGNPDIPYGVRDYKKKFGGAIVNFGRYEKIQSNLKYSLACKGMDLWHKIKHKN